MLKCNKETERKAGVFEMNEMLEKLGQNAKDAETVLRNLSTNDKNKTLEAAAAALVEHTEEILKANALDVENGRKNQMSEGLIDRLMLTPERIEGMADGLRQLRLQHGQRFVADRRRCRHQCRHIHRDSAHDEQRQASLRQRHRPIRQRHREHHGRCLRHIPSYPCHGYRRHHPAPLPTPRHSTGSPGRTPPRTLHRGRKENSEIKSSLIYPIPRTDTLYPCGVLFYSCS